MEELPQSIKVTLLGDPGVGKTCIISRYIYNEFKENNTPTTVANYSEKIILKRNKRYALNIWDTAGQEKFHSICKHFYKDSLMVCLVYDITNQKSLEQLKTIWYPDVKNFGEKYTIIGVVGNKSDLYEEGDLADENEARQFAKEIGGIFMLTSAKTGDGIEKLFEDLLNKFLSPEFKQKYVEYMKMKESSQILRKNKLDKNGKKKGCC